MAHKLASCTLNRSPIKPFVICCQPDCNNKVVVLHMSRLSYVEIHAGNCAQSACVLLCRASYESWHWKFVKKNKCFVVVTYSPCIFTKCFAPINRGKQMQSSRHTLPLQWCHEGENKTFCFFWWCMVTSHPGDTRGVVLNPRVKDYVAVNTDKCTRLLVSGDHIGFTSRHLMTQLIFNGSSSFT